jgi:hypothetical protein
VSPNLGALPETTAGFATMYQYNEDMNAHANVFANLLNQSIKIKLDGDNVSKYNFQKNWADSMYNWDYRAAEWTGLLQGLLK